MLRLIENKEWKIKSSHINGYSVMHIIENQSNKNDVRRISDVGWKQYPIVEKDK